MFPFSRYFFFLFKKCVLWKYNFPIYIFFPLKMNYVDFYIFRAAWRTHIIYLYVNLWAHHQTYYTPFYKKEKKTSFLNVLEKKCLKIYKLRSRKINWQLRHYFQLEIITYSLIINDKNNSFKVRLTARTIKVVTLKDFFLYICMYIKLVEFKWKSSG